MSSTTLVLSLELGRRRGCQVLYLQGEDEGENMMVHTGHDALQVIILRRLSPSARVVLTSENLQLAYIGDTASAASFLTSRGKRDQPPTSVLHASEMVSGHPIWQA